MKSVNRIAELISRGLQEDGAAQKAVEEIFARAQNDSELQEYFMDAANRVRDGRVQITQEKDSESLFGEVQGELDASQGPSEREAKLLRMVIEAKKRIKELEGGTGLRTGEAGAQGTGLSQGQHRPEAGTAQGREARVGQEGRR